MDTEPKVLFYDIETACFPVWVFGIGNNLSISHEQIVEGHAPDIICICYKWAHEDEVHSLDWGYYKQDSGPMVEKFDKIIDQADITIGHNSDKFDARHINTQRLLHDLPPMPDWIQSTDDTLKQIRKHFYLASNRLDYVSKILGFKGKHKMHLQDWIDVVEKNSRKSLKKMVDYCKRDVLELESVYNRIKPHITPKLNMATFLQDGVCTTCGSKDIRKNGTRVAGKTKYQSYYCNKHGGYAGRAPIRKQRKTGKTKTGKIG